MSDWTDGYVAGIDYTFGYYGELNPLRVPLPFLNVGLMPPEIATACELGLGQGLSANIHAAAAPQVRWYGTDFNPAHVAFARSLAAASGADAQFADQSFAEFCARSDLPDFDYIGVHGVWSWISAENQRIVVDFLRRKLKVGGVAYISYNVQPGFAAMVPLRRLMMQHIEVTAGRGGGIVPQIDAALEFADKLLALTTAFTVANPTIAQRLGALKQHSRNYLAHEYFNRDWDVVPFADMAARLAPAKLAYACSAYYLDHIDGLNLTADNQRFLAEIPDPVFRQSVRDFIVNQQFRRDYWVKGGQRLPPLAQAEALRRLRVVLVAGPRSEIPLAISGALGQREMTANVYGPILDALADHAPRTIADLEQATSSAGLRLATIFEALMVLAGRGDVAPAQDEETLARARAHTGPLNRRIIEQARSSGDLACLASPVTGGGVAVPRFYQLFLLALQHGRDGADDMARFAWDLLALQGQRVVKDGKTLETGEENLTELTGQAREFVDKRLPALRRLQIA